MFSCPACLRRAINNVALETTSSPLLSSSPARITRNRTFKRTHATYESLTTGHHRRAFRQAVSKGPLTPNKRRKGAGSLTKGEIKDALARENNRSLLLSNDDPSASKSTPEERKKFARLRQDVEQYYADPLQLANAVTSKLRIPDFEGAIGLVRASEGIVAGNIVSWNHCIDWCMIQGEPNRAWKLYNELKKRGNHPDNHTYTILLRGLSQNSRKAGSGERAVAIYNNMFTPNSKVVVNTIHTNSALNVCARTRDMNSLWAIAGRMPEKGVGAPDRLTFTTILHAIRDDATTRVAELLRNPKKDEDGAVDEQVKVIFDEALKDGRKLWADVSHRWRRANLIIDEHLVVAMGRLILGCGRQSDFVEVFDLVDSTMNIRLAERGHRKGLSQAEQETKPDEEVEDETEVTSMTSYNPSSTLPLSDSQVYATPGHHTLSMILKAALDSKQMKIGKAYWHILTTQNGPHKVVPDTENIISYLRLLRLSRSSQDALEVLSRDWPKEVSETVYRRSTFVIAMSTCVRDKNSPHSFDTADKLLALMQEKLEDQQLGTYDKIDATENNPNLSFKERQAATKARISNIDDVTFGEDEALSEVQRTKSGVESSIIDPKALRMYIDLAVHKTEGWNEGLGGRDTSEKFNRNPAKNLTIRALRRLGPNSINIMRLAKLKVIESEIAKRPLPTSQRLDFSRNGQLVTNDRAGTRVAEKLEDLVDLLRSIVSALDKVISLDERFEEAGLPRLDKTLVENYRDQKRRVSGFLSRTKDEVLSITRGSMKYAKWRTQPEEDDEDDNEDRETPTYQRRQQRKEELPTIAKELRRIYEDTDRSIGRLEQRSRRQKLERHNGVQKRIKKRLGVGLDVGVLDDDLNIRKREEVEGRMRERAFGIHVDARRGGRTTRGGAERAGLSGEHDGMRRLREAVGSA